MRKMKDSGVAWIGEIPEGWYYSRLKYDAYMKGRIGWQGLKADEFIEKGPYLVTGTDFENGKVVWEKCYHITEERFEEAPEIHLKNGDLLITKDGTIGKLAYIDKIPGKASLNSHLLVIRPTTNRFINKFLYWVFSSSVFEEYTQYAQNGTIMDSLSQEKIAQFVFGCPNKQEQEGITDYLDHICAEIDSLVNAKEVTNKKLKGYRQSVIYEAITKGLDKNTKMKDSGVEWIGEIPEGWEVWRLKHLAKIPLQYGANESGVDYSEELPRYIRITDITQDNKLRDDEKLSLTNEQSEGYILDNGDVLFARSGATAGKSFYYTTDMGRSGFAGYLIRFQTKGEVILSKLVYYYTLTSAYSEWTNQIFIQATIQNISAEKYNNLIFAVPPTIKEQRKIADYLDQKCADIGSVISANEKIIEKLKEYRQSVIYEAVTGKVEV